MTLRKQEHLGKLKRKHSAENSLSNGPVIRRTKSGYIIQVIYALRVFNITYFGNEEVGVKNCIRSPWRKESARKTFRKVYFRKLWLHMFWVWLR